VELPPDTVPPYVSSTTSSPPIYCSAPPPGRGPLLRSLYRGGIPIASFKPHVTLSQLSLPDGFSLPADFEYQILPCLVRIAQTTHTNALLPVYSSPTSTLPRLRTLYDLLHCLHSSLAQYITITLWDFNAYTASVPEFSDNPQTPGMAVRTGARGRRTHYPQEISRTGADLFSSRDAPLSTAVQSLRPKHKPEPCLLSCPRDGIASVPMT